VIPCERGRGFVYEVHAHGVHRGTSASNVSRDSIIRRIFSRVFLEGILDVVSGPEKGEIAPEMARVSV
jgi:hypothetical protein